MNKFLGWLKKEITQLIPVWAFFFFFIALLRTTEWAIRRELGISGTVIPKVIIVTFLISKVFIVLDNLKFMNKFANRPLIYSIIFKTFFYALGVLLARIIEELFSKSLIQIYESMFYLRFWIIQVWTIVLLFIFCSARELIRKIGKDKFKKLVFSGP